MDADEVSAEDIELEYVSTAGVRERGPLSRLWPVRFESVRLFPLLKGLGLELPFPRSGLPPAQDLDRAISRELHATGRRHRPP